MNYDEALREIFFPHSLTLAWEIFSYLQNIDVQLISMIIQKDLMYECVFLSPLKVSASQDYCLRARNFFFFLLQINGNFLYS